MREVMSPLEADLEALSTASSEAFAGISAFNPDDYKGDMSGCREYECNVVLT